MSWEGMWYSVVLNHRFWSEALLQILIPPASCFMTSSNYLTSLYVCLFTYESDHSIFHSYCEDYMLAQSLAYSNNHHYYWY